MTYTAWDVSAVFCALVSNLRHAVVEDAEALPRPFYRPPALDQIAASLS